MRLASAPGELTAPVLKSPALKTNIAPTVIVAVLLQPDKPSAGVMISLIKSRAITSSATKFTGSFSVTNKKNGEREDGDDEKYFKVHRRKFEVSRLFSAKYRLAA
jgi:hypothetical protein